MFPGLLALVVPVFAQDVPCEIMRERAFLSLLNEIDYHLKTFDMDMAGARSQELYSRLPCLITPMKPSMFTRFARQRATLSFFNQDEEQVIRWGMAARGGLPEYPWPSDIGEDHPVRGTINFGEEPAEVSVEGQVLLPPKKGLVLLNGHPISTPTGREGMPQLLQVLDRELNILDAYWQEGAAFLPERLSEEGKPPEIPKTFEVEDAAAAIAAATEMYATGANASLPQVVAVAPKPVAPKPTIDTGPKVPDEDIPDLPIDLSLEALEPVDATWTTEKGWLVATPVGGEAPAVATADPGGPSQPTEPITASKPEPRPRPPKQGGGLQVNLLPAAIGGGAALIAGALYAGASVSQQGMTNATTEDQLLGVRSRTNLLVITSGVAGAAAVGLGVTAFISADGGTLGLSTRF